MKLASIAGLVLLSAIAATARAQTVALVPTEYAGIITVDEAEAYYKSVLGSLAKVKDIRLLERKQLKLVMDERDLALALTPDQADKAYAASGKGMKVNHVLVPSLSRIENDYILCLRKIQISNGATVACRIRKTRLVAKFDQQAQAQVRMLWSESSVGAEPDARENDVSLDDLRAACRKAAAPRLFPALWQRAQKMSEDKSLAAPADIARFYVGLLTLSSHASRPPEGMVFVPGGYVALKTSEGQRKLWVEPFFIDRTEVSVGTYGSFLETLGNTEDGRGKRKAFSSITGTLGDFNGAKLPITGVTHSGAAAFAAAEGKCLPTMLQWLRAAGDDGREFPCGTEEDARKCNLSGDEDGYAILASADEPGKDASPFGVLGMSGNVREWTASWHAKDAYAQTPEDSPEEPRDGTLRLIMGGSWRTDVAAARLPAAGAGKPGEASDDVGFRCAKSFFRSVSAETAPRSDRETVNEKESENSQ